MTNWETCVQFHGHACGEVTGANWIRLVGGQKLCLDCAGNYDRFDV